MGGAGPEMFFDNFAWGLGGVLISYSTMLMQISRFMATSTVQKSKQ